MNSTGKKLHIAMLGHKRIPSREGGIEIVVEELSVRMAEKGLAAITSSLFMVFGNYDVVHFHAEGLAFMRWLPKVFKKKVIVTIHGATVIIMTLNCSEIAP